MQFTDIGQQLRAYRLGSGLRAEEIAARLGVSRAALYRYEKGDVIKLDTVKRLAELLRVSPLSLLGIGVEYYTRVGAFHERLRQVEEMADHILQVGGPACYLTTSDEFESVVGQSVDATGMSPEEQTSARTAQEQLAGILAARKRTYRARRPNVIALLDPRDIEDVLRVRGSSDGMTEATRRTLRAAAVREVERAASQMEAAPIGLQLGLLSQTITGAYILIRSRERETVAINPLRTGALGGGEPGVGMITAAVDAFQLHQRAAETLWRKAMKGAEGAARLRALIASTEPG